MLKNDGAWHSASLLLRNRLGSEKRDNELHLPAFDASHSSENSVSFVSEDWKKEVMIS